MDDNQLVIRWSMDDYGYDFDEAEPYINQWQGSIILKSESDKEEAEKLIGSISAWDIKIGKISDELGLGLGLHELLDSISADGAAIYEDLFDVKKDTFRETLCKRLWGSAYFDPEEMEVSTTNLIYLDRVFVHPPYRGQGFGLRAIRAAIKRFDQRQTLVYCYPKPLQYAGSGKSLNPNYPERRDQAKDTLKLIRYYEQLGLKVYFPDRKTQTVPKNFEPPKHRAVMVGMAHWCKAADDDQ